MDVRCYTRSILNGLIHIHDQDLVQCDLKPQNIFICENNVAKIADFGLAVKRDRLSRVTPLYVAPEEIILNRMSDIWGLGCIVLKMLTGSDPWGFDPKADQESTARYIVETDDLPMIRAQISNLAKDFLSCLVRNMKLLWTTNMLMDHPFICSINEDIIINEYLQKRREEEMEIENNKRKREAEELKKKKKRKTEAESKELKKMKKYNYGGGIETCAEMMIEALNQKSMDAAGRHFGC